MTYLEFLNRLESEKEDAFANFQARLIPTKQKILGVRTPALRKIAKEYRIYLEDIFAFPDEYYETTFIKLAIVATLEYSQFLKYVEACVALMDNWATCDLFKAACIQKHKAEFLPILAALFEKREEFYERYVLTTLLYCYVEREYLNILEEYLKRADTQFYYVHMAAAWLTAEILIKEYDFGIELLNRGVLDKKTHNKAIQKALESFRLTQEQKAFLRAMKK